jgi:hypothetical protein
MSANIHWIKHKHLRSKSDKKPVVEVKSETK